MRDAISIKALLSHCLLTLSIEICLFFICIDIRIIKTRETSIKMKKQKLRTKVERRKVPNSFSLVILKYTRLSCSTVYNPHNQIVTPSYNMTTGKIAPTNGKT
jgi:hypothetical protein